MALTLQSTIKLPSGALMPRLGFGVYQASGTECENAVKEAFRAGYRHVDSAQIYRNEDIVGKAVKDMSLPRSEVFLTTKYYPDGSHSKAQVTETIRTSLNKIDMVSESDKKYIDLLLTHAPFGGPKGRKTAWAAMAEAQKKGWVKDIGVSNYAVRHLEELPAPKPAINQIEVHPFYQRREIVEYCEKNGIIVQAYCPLVRADPMATENPVLLNIAKKHGKEVMHVLVRWSLQKGYIPLPKSVTPKRVVSNAQVYDFELDKEDMSAIDGLDRGPAGRVTWDPTTAP
ncbi:hypothetical protein IAR55_002311 [Kwoniella newhampshirensis]|uniref:NADP-dependent oxidoreductase domain-containing protein n=1 Tax=Kwoniella newhampshirensis TaxID=1651941 RepID=A0AAW0Z0G8_9TREE